MSIDPKDNVKQLLRDRGICVVIPTYNNSQTIKQVVEDTLVYCADVIVVCDGCTDNTLDILKEIQGITLVDYTNNRGKGYALKMGFKTALAMGFSYAITIDSDGQHYPSNIPDFLEANIKNPGALIVGQRNLEGVVRTKGSNFANKFSNFWFFVQTGRNLKDTQTGYRLYPLKKLCGLSLLTSRYEAELELMVFASWCGVKIVSIPIDVYYPKPEDRVSHFRPIADFARISLLNTILCVGALLFGLPMAIIRLCLKWWRTIYSLLFFIVTSVFIATPLLWLYMKIGRVTEHKRTRLHNLIYHYSRFVMIHHGIPGTEFSTNLPLHKADLSTPAVITCNHQSHIDLMCLLALSPKIVFLTNDWVWNSPFYGFIIRNAEYLPVKDGLEAIMPQLKSLVERGYSIAVFPEGTRSQDCVIRRFYRGASFIAESFDLDILPMLLYGPGKVLQKHSRHLESGPIHVEVYNRITQAELKKVGDIKAQTSYLKRFYVEQYNKLCNKIEQEV
ncbi:MAG: glycosyltransferase [Bacteroidia bacterium]|nr:glycosyltransferase [Bacteroidia bacterium]